MKQKASQKNDRLKQMKRYVPFYLFALPAIICVILFNYLPMKGIIIAFKDYKMARGIAGSEWVGLKHFKAVFTDPNFYRVLGNTLKISILTLLTTFPVTIVFTILMNELRGKRFKKCVQTITYMPHFLSWVVVGTFVYQILSPTGGMMNTILVKLGVLDSPYFFMADQKAFVPIYLVTNLWKTTGYSIVIYLATISGIDTSLYDAASIDGANRFQRILHITLPAMLPTMCTMLILQVGNLISVGFDPIYNLYNDATYQTADVISTYVYRKGMIESRYDLSTAIGLFQNVVSLALVLSANWFARKTNPEYKII
ncbi:MAG: ABC transporter permease [Fusicatenibacter sp.]|nr:ABC transporter permease subunit [Fusicatenibacter sp.]